MTAPARFLLSKPRLLEQFRTLNDLGLAVSYSLKTNPLAGQLLEKETKCSFSVHSKTELHFISDKKRVWFISESWDREDIQDITSQGVRSFIVHNENDLDKLLSFLEGKDLKVDLLLRIKMKENTIFTGKHFVFGMNADRVNDILLNLRNSPNIGKLGVHFHRKTQNVSEWNLREEVENILLPETLEKMDILNIGGGLPVEYKNTGWNRMEYAFSKIKELKAWLDTLDVETIIEPGRFLSGPAIRLDAGIVNIFENNIVVNCSVYNSSMDSVVLPIKLLVEGELPAGRAYVIKGNTPCSLDIFRYSVHLSEKRVGDRIVFLNAGAYNFHTDFCSLGRIETVIEE